MMTYDYYLFHKILNLAVLIKLTVFIWIIVIYNKDNTEGGTLGNMWRNCNAVTNIYKNFRQFL